MKDFDKDIGMSSNDAYDNRHNKKPLSEDKNDKTFENFKEGCEENEKGLDSQSENFEKEAEAAEGEGQADLQKEGDNCGQDRGNEPVNAQYSSYYSPPYYVPNFTVCEPVEPIYEKSVNDNKKRNNYFLIGVIVALSVVVCLLFTMFFFLMRKISRQEQPSIDLGREELNVIQNSPQMNIQKETDSEYVPKSLPEVVSKVGNSVVEIKTSGRQSSFYGQYITSGAGSGVIVAQSDEAGYLLTNHHVVYSSSNVAMDTVTVVLTNEDEYTATIIGSDESIDLAVLRIEKKAKEQFTVANFADSSKLVVGQDVIAIGNPLGSLGGTVTDGIISALDRRVNIDGITMVLLQHNAAINPGNSGGALFDMMGNLVGIVNAKSSDSGIEGLGFAIPSNIALNFLNRVMVLEPAIGIKVQYGRLNGEYGLYVISTNNEEFSKYDRIVAVNGEDIENAAQYYAIIDGLNIGDVATITVERNRAKIDINVTLSE